MTNSPTNSSLTCRTLAQAARLSDTLMGLGHASEAITDSKGRPTLITSAPGAVLDAVVDAEAA